MRALRAAARMAWLATIIILLGFTVMGGGDVFQPSDQSPAKGNNPCKDFQTPAGKITDEFYNSFKDMVSDVLGDKAGVITDIDNQVKSRVPDANERAVSIEIFVVTEDEFKQAYVDDVDSLNPNKTKDVLTQEAGQIFNSSTAYTYITDKRNTGGVQKIKIKVFCKTAFRNGVIDGSMRETLVHELVHAKLYAMWVLGISEQVGNGEGNSPFKDHDNDSSNDGDANGDKPFFDEVNRLYSLLKKNLKLAYAPNSSQSSPILATVVITDPTGRNPSEEVTLFGDITFTNGPVSDNDNDGLIEVETEIVEMQLTGTGGQALTVNLSSGGVSFIITEELDPGEPFPAVSILDLSLDFTQGGSAVSQQTTLEATIQSWPPFADVYTNNDPKAPLDLAEVRFDPVDLDDDGLPDYLDPDDDNDGIPDVEDSDPFTPYSPSPAPYSHELEVARGTTTFIRPDETFTDFWSAASEGRQVTPIAINTLCLPVVGCSLQISGGIEDVKFVAAPAGTRVLDEISDLLPSGLELHEPSGVIHGTPSQPGTSRTLIQAIDERTAEAIAELLLEIQVVDVPLATVTICAQLISANQEVFGVPIAITPPGISLPTQVMTQLPLGIYAFGAPTEIATGSGPKRFQYWTRQDGTVIATTPVLTILLGNNLTVCAWYE